MQSFLLADLALSGSWTPTNVLIIIVALGYLATTIINAIKGNPQQQNLLQLIQQMQTQHTAQITQQQSSLPQLLNMVASNPQLAQALLLYHKQQTQPAKPAPVAPPTPIHG